MTGGGGGIGRAVARTFAEAGAKVVVAGRDEAKLRETVAMIEDEGGTASGFAADITVESEVAALIERCAQEHEGLDVAVNNAGVVGPPGPLSELDSGIWDDVLPNLTGTFLCLKQEMAYMSAHGGGAIVNIASNIGAHTARPGMAAYGVSKAAVAALTRFAALEGIPDGIRVNAISPGASDTPMSLRPGETDEDRAARIAAAIPIGRLDSLDELSSAVLWLAGDGAGFAVRHDFVFDGGASL